MTPEEQRRAALNLLAYLGGRFQGKFTAMLDQATKELAGQPEGDLAGEFAARLKGESDD